MLSVIWGTISWVVGISLGLLLSVIIIIAFLAVAKAILVHIEGKVTERSIKNSVDAVREDIRKSKDGFGIKS